MLLKISNTMKSDQNMRPSNVYLQPNMSGPTESGYAGHISSDIQDGHELQHLSEHNLPAHSSSSGIPLLEHSEDNNLRLYSLSSGNDTGIPKRVNSDNIHVQPYREFSAAGSTSLGLTWREKTGWITTISLIFGTLLALAALAVLGFLWFGHSGNRTWRAVMVGGWLSTAITICGGVIQQVVNLQLGVAAAMLASLALESRDVLLSDLASVSMLRATASATSVFTMFWQFLRRHWSARRVKRHWTGVSFLLILTLLLWALNQFLLVIIVTDVALRPTDGEATNSSVPYSLHYFLSGTSLQSRAIPNRGAWFTKPTAFAAFAEYSEPPYIANGVSDTGRTLRAFLPMKTVDLRDNLKSYKGNATVLDARVTCQVPTLNSATISVPSTGGDLFQLNGTVAASRETPRLGNRTLNAHSGTEGLDWGIDSPVAFLCHGAIIDTDTEWRISICQLYEGGNRVEGGTAETFSGGLVSEFRNLTSFMSVADNGSTANTDPSTYGTAYLILNSTLGSQYDWEAGLEVPDDNTSGYYPVAYQERGEWLDLVYSRSNVILSVSLCYAAFDFADVPVQISSNINRTETSFDPVYDSNTSMYTFAALRKAMGQDKSTSLADRGQLELAGKPSWLTSPGENFAPLSNSANDPSSSELYLRSLADIGFDSKMDISMGNIGNISGIILPDFTCPDATATDAECVVPELMHIRLVQEILRTGGTIAFALQTMITLLSGMVYYDQMGQFDKVTAADMTMFQVASVPTAHRGFVVVAAMLLVHLGTVATILLLFLRRTSFSRLGACWSTLAQVGTGDVARHLGYSTLLSDGQVEEEMRKHGIGHEKVHLEAAGEDIRFTHK